MGDEDVQEIVETAAQRIVQLLQRRGLLDDSQIDELTETEALQAASVQGQLACRRARATPSVRGGPSRS